MATQIINQATLNYNSGDAAVSTSSNIAIVTMQGPLEATKYSLETAYQLGDEITYNVFITNTSAATLSNLVVTDNLGTYPLVGEGTATPLTYVGPAKIFINNVFSSTVTGTVSTLGNSVEFQVGNLAPASTMLLEYKVATNGYAPAVVGTSNIVNTVSITGNNITAPITASNTLPLDSFADVTIEKTMSPDPVVDGNPLNYTFLIRNYGTLAATNVVLTDTLANEPTITAVTVDGVATTDYTYTAGEFQYPATSSTLTYSIPAATFVQNPTTGLVTIDPSTSTIVIQGTI